MSSMPKNCLNTPDVLPDTRRSLTAPLLKYPDNFENISFAESEACCIASPLAKHKRIFGSSPADSATATGDVPAGDAL